MALADVIHLDRHRRHVAVGRAVVGLVLETVRAAEVGVGRIDEAAVALQGQRAVLRDR